MKVLFYIDSVVAYGNSVSAAEMLRRKLDDQIVVMCVDSKKYLNETTKAYEIYDYSGLVRPGTGFVCVWPESEGSAGLYAPSRFGVALRAVRNAIRRTRWRAGLLRRWMFEEPPDR